MNVCEGAFFFQRRIQGNSCDCSIATNLDKTLLFSFWIHSRPLIDVYDVSVELCEGLTIT